MKFYTVFWTIKGFIIERDRIIKEEGKKMFRAMIILAVFLAMAGTSKIIIPAYCEDITSEEQLSVPVVEETLSLDGEILSVDLENSNLTVNQLKDAENNTYEEVVISVLPETQIIKDDVALNLYDLKSGDKVTLEYITGDAGECIVRSIIVKGEEI